MVQIHKLVQQQTTISPAKTNLFYSENKTVDSKRLFLKSFPIHPCVPIYGDEKKSGSDPERTAKSMPISFG